MRARSTWDLEEHLDRADLVDLTYPADFMYVVDLVHQVGFVNRVDLVGLVDLSIGSPRLNLHYGRNSRNLPTAHRSHALVAKINVPSSQKRTAC